MHTSFIIILSCILDNLVFVFHLAVSQQEHTSLSATYVKGDNFLEWVKDVSATVVSLESADFFQNLIHSFIGVVPYNLEILTLCILHK